jgi:hypothetical protein
VQAAATTSLGTFLKVYPSKVGPKLAGCLGEAEKRREKKSTKPYQPGPKSIKSVSQEEQTTDAASHCRPSKN